MSASTINTMCRVCFVYMRMREMRSREKVICAEKSARVK